MAKKGIKIKDLAKELAVTSRDVISKCRAEGIPAQNSITRLGHAAERAVRAFFSDATSERNANGASDEPAHDDDATPRIQRDRFRAVR